MERYHKERDLPLLDKTKFLVPEELTMSQFVTIIRSEGKEEGRERGREGVRRRKWEEEGGGLKKKDGGREVKH